MVSGCAIVAISARAFLPSFCPISARVCALCVCELHPSCDLVTQEMVFHRQIRIAQAEFLIHRVGGRRQQLLPIHESFHQSQCPLLRVSMGYSSVGCKMGSKRW